MELVKAEKSEVVVLGKGFVSVFGFFFTGTENEFTKLRNLKKSGDKISIVIDPTGRVTIESEVTSSQ